MEIKDKYTIDDLIEIMRILRAPGGCPWDMVQTHDSIKKSMIEESYEAIDALDSGDDHAFANELGDVLLQVVFHAEIAKERGAFDFDAILKEVCDKLISRHSHVFGEDKAKDAESALSTWEKNKKKEKNLGTFTDTLKDVPQSLPALMRAEKVQKKASAVGFDWPADTVPYDKIIEEANELRDAVATGNEAKIEEEYGDLLFSTVNVGRHLHICPETSLTDSIRKFINRFEQCEKLAKEGGKELDSCTAAELDTLWNKAKQNEC